MPNIAGYQDNDDGTSVLIFDDGQTSAPVILTDDDRREIDDVAMAVSDSGAGLPSMDQLPKTITNKFDPGLGSQAAPSEPYADDGGFVDTSKPAPAAEPPARDAFTKEPVTQEYLDSDPMSAQPTQAAAPVAKTTLPIAQETTENPMGEDAPEVRQNLLDAAYYREQAEAEKTIAREKAATEKAKLIGQRVAQMDVERKANEIEEAQRKAAIEQATKKYEAVSQRQLDPKQAFGSEPAWFKILTLIGLAAGAAHSGKSHSLEAVNNTINQSLKLQQEQKDSEVNRLSKFLGSQEAGLAAVKARMHEAVERRLELGILQADNDAEAQWLRSSASAIRAQRLEEEAKAKAATATAIRTQTMPPKPVGANPARKWNVETAEERSVLDKWGTDPKKMAKYTDERVKLGVDGTIKLADDAEATITRLAEGQDVPGSGFLDRLLQPYVRGEEGAAVQQVSGALIAQFQKSISGASTTDSERETLRKLVEGRGTLADWKRGIAIIKSQATTQINSLDNGYSSEAGAYNEIGGIRRDRAREAERQRLHENQQKEAERKAAIKAEPKGAHDSPLIYKNETPEEENDPFESGVMPKWK